MKRLKLCLFAMLTLPAFSWAAIPVILDTDIGTDIDDAYALAVVLERPELELLGVTTVSSDAVARARLAAKLLAEAGGRFAQVPVYAGISSATQYMKQVEWANGFSSPTLHTEGAVEFMHREVNARPGEITIIAIGELTNVAALLESDPGIGKKIRAVALMGGAVHRGYEPGSAPEPEWNIKSNVAAAKAVFRSGVPLLVAPLDSTADLQLTPEMRVEMFARGTDFNDALAALDYLWVHTNTWKAAMPTLFDVLAVQLVAAQPCPLEDLYIEVTDAGITKRVEGKKPNAKVALECSREALLRQFVDQVAR